MDTLLIVALIVCGLLFIFGIIGSILNWAKGLIRTLFSIFGFLAVVFVIIYFVNGQQLPF